RLGSYISQGVYTVSGPFHPFGGAVDIVVVQQQDGSLKSSPWYVRFGKFQGVLKMKVRVVDINVNGVDAGFHMYLDPRGEAYFLREVDSEEAEAAFDQCNSVGDVSNGAVLSRTDSKRSRILGFVLGKRSMKEENASNIDRKTLEASLVLHEQHFVDKLDDTRIDHEVSDMEVEETISRDICENFVSDESSRTQLDGANEPEVGLITGEGSLESVPESYTEVAPNQGDASIEVVSCSSVPPTFCQNVDDNLAKEVDEKNETRPPLEPNGDFQVFERYEEEQLIFGDLDDSKPCINRIEQEVKQEGSESTSAMYIPDPITVGTYQEPSKNDLEGLIGDIRKCPSNLDISRSSEVTEADVGRANSLPNMWYQFDDPITDNRNDPPVGKLKSSKWDLLRGNVSRIIKATNLEKELPPNADNVSNDLKDSSITSEINAEKEWSLPKSNKKHIRTLTPTSEQLASLNLAEGQNIITFTFSTAVLGTQKVDARIYLWRWDTRIVISDVDGTITKSDVLGQFMPLVGRDWSHIGVTHLFSAIKENGYQMLYLSARAVSQASITRQFLFNLKQDGKALPDGPVVISPDGLFPSLFREVIRRVPHEFKIACLEGEVVINRSIDSRSYASLHALVNGIFPPTSGHEEEDYNSWNFWKLPPPTIE
ncbi:hypothetical protein M8C21_001264, partial [Ambrosia artemisiifolia]